MDWGTVPAWISAIATTLGFTATVLTINRSRTDQRYEDARLVLPTVDEETASVIVQNCADRPIWRLHVHLVIPRTGSRRFRFWERPRTVNVKMDPDIRLDSDQKATGSIPVNIGAFVQRDHVLMLYRDSRGREWKRMGDRRPQRTDAVWH